MKNNIIKILLFIYKIVFWFFNFIKKNVLVILVIILILININNSIKLEEIKKDTNKINRIKNAIYYLDRIEDKLEDIEKEF